MLRSLRKKHQDRDLVNEDSPLKKIRWEKLAAKQRLKKLFRGQAIAADYKDAEKVWKDYCEGHTEFARMELDDAFKRRLGTVQDDYVKKDVRCKADLEACRAAKKNHPTPELNHRGEPQWNGSEAQILLKEMVAIGSHICVLPNKLWEDEEEFQVCLLQTFRDHIYQEERLVKFENVQDLMKKRKLDELQY